MHNRNDLRTARLIEEALKEGGSKSRINTAWELVEQGVPVGVAARIVARPADRRPTTPSQMANNATEDL
jgi:hypothetical protein